MEKRIEKRRLDRERFDKLARQHGFVRANGKINESALAKAMGVKPSQVHRWRAGHHAPGAGPMGEMRRLFGVSDEHLLGKEEERKDQRREVIEAVRRMFGRAEADAVEQLARLTDHHKAIVAGRLQGWIEALERYELPGTLHKPADAVPVSPFDRDKARLSEGARRPRRGEQRGVPRVEPTASPPK